MHSALLPALALLLCAADVLACSRAALPRTAAIAEADVIAVATAVRIAPIGEGPREYELRVERALKGSAAGTVTATRSLGAEMCKPHPLVEGRRYLVYLRGGALMLDGTAPHTAAEERTLLETLPRMPRWSKPRNGVSLVVVPETFAIGAEQDLRLWVLYRNVGGRPVTLQYRDRVTFWTAAVTHRGRPVESRPHPYVTAAEIDAHFSRNPHRFEWTLEPGQTFPFSIGPLNTARPGWGYRERMNFRWWPMTRPGRYSIVMRGNLAGGEEAERFEVSVSAASRP